MAHPTTVDRLALGDHVCWTFQGEGERLDAMARFVSAGLEHGHKVVYSTASLAPAAVLAGLRARGVRVAEPARTGQLQAQSSATAFTAAGDFSADQLLDAYATEIARSDREGYAGVRIIGDMAWASDSAVTTEALAEFEVRANALFAQGHAVGLCQYDRRQFPATALRRVGAAHFGTTWSETDQRWSPLLRMTRTENPPGLRLVGEVDISNYDAFTGVLRAAVAEQRADPRPTALVIDAGALRFVDARGVGLLVEAAATAPAGVHLRCCQPVLAQSIAAVEPGAPGLTVSFSDTGAT
ncbi:MEDS domain-containing protein [Natronosporangium hydrolyticum]|uniref:MEDS domain-containing protein n=1 Tax=Natronosporangium hydrolyticum TaxID=2811111 RepID=A0A895Y8L8_9ACTN|nr:MEDS domain-containing protein [Natronosporangium hydrolyticum]QSB14084.1 MEDS domain-containing protein [Natronosporangium hydrolyticum]